MAVAIVTKYHGPTNYRGSRITASVPARLDELTRGDRDPSNELDRPSHWRLTIPYRYDLSPEDGHRAAAQALADRLGWVGTLAGGALADGYAFVFVGNAYGTIPDPDPGRDERDA